MFDNVAGWFIVFRNFLARASLSGSFSRGTLRHNQIPSLLKRRIQHAARDESVSIVCGNKLNGAGDEIGYRAVLVLLEAPGPRGVEFGPLGCRQYAAFGD